MADLGATYADDALEDLEKQLKSLYNAAYKDILQKQKDFNAAYAKKEAMYQAKLAAGQITQEQFDNWKKGQVFQGEQWQAKKQQILDTLSSSNTIATKMINGQMTNVFAFNANYQAFNLEHDAGVNFGFGLYDSATVTNLVKNNPKLLPEWKIDQPKDYIWNQKKLNRQVSLGIIEGESLDKIANRLCDALSTQNFNHMRTFARTAMTGAQNAGREFSLQAAYDKGIDVEKEWMCTLDGHTRINHRLLDGQKRPLDKPFEAGGMKIRYPGDPEAHPSMVYNCRCTMVGSIEDYPATYDRYDNIDGKPIKNMTYAEWVNAKSAGLDIGPVPLTFSHADVFTMALSAGDADDLMDLFKGLKMSNVYNDMKAMGDSKSANQLYKELKGMGKPSDVWQQYLDGTLPAAQADKITQILNDYAEKAGLLKKPVNLAEQFLDKKMSNVYNEMKGLDSTTANQFYKELKGMGKPSDIWQQYLDGILPDDQKAIIEKYLQKCYDANGKLLSTADTASKVATKSIKDLFPDKHADIPDDLESEFLNFYYDNGLMIKIKGMPMDIEAWEMYMNGTLPPDIEKQIDDFLEKYAKDHGLLKNIAKTATDAASAAIKTQANIADQFVDKKMSSVYNEMKGVDTTAANQFYKELKQMGKPSDVWQKYLNGELTDEQKSAIEKYLQKYYDKDGKLLQAAAKAVDATAKAADNLDDLEKAKKKLEAAQKAVDDLQDADKVFKGIWKDDVTYADYEAKKGNIAAKKQYYIDQIAKAEANGWHAKADILNDFLEELEEFEKNGEEYSKKLKALQDAKEAVKKLTPTPSSFDPSAYSDKVKNAAKNFTNRKVADNFHRQYLDSIWDDLTDEEKYGVWEYTRNSNPMNKSLSGYHDNWNRSSFLGPDNTDWGHEDPWRSLPSAFKKYGKGGNVTYHKAITDTTKAIEKSVLPEACYLVRGSDNGGFAGMIENGPLSFDQAKTLLDNGNVKEIAKVLEGQVVQNHAFTSTGIASGTGFSGEVSYKIYAPKGTRAIYAEPQSYFGDTVGSNAKLYKKGQSYSGVGGEAEVILQRGTKFRITKIESSGYSGITVHMEVIEQPDYFKFGDEDTFNSGKTRHKK